MKENTNPVITKYKMTDQTKRFKGHTLHRIVALRDFNDVKTGDLGGWIESYNNLDQDGDCWIYHKGKAFESSNVNDNAIVTHHGIIRGNAIATNCSKIEHFAVVTDGAYLQYHAKATGHCLISGETLLSDDCTVGEHAFVTHGAMIKDTVLIIGHAQITDNAVISGDVCIGHLTHIGIHGRINSEHQFVTIENLINFGSSSTLYRGIDDSEHKTYVASVQNADRAIPLSDVAKSPFYSTDIGTQFLDKLCDLIHGPHEPIY